MKLIRLVPVILGLATGIAQAQPPVKAPPASGPAMASADVQRWLVFFDKLVETVVNNAQNCDKMANDVGTVIDGNKSALELARNARNARKTLPLSAQQHMMDGVKKMGPGIQNCGEKDNVKAAFAKLDSHSDTARADK